MKLIERRVGLIFALFLVGLAIALTKAMFLGVVRADSLRKLAAVQQTAQVTVPAPRGNITDRNGDLLAVSEPALNVIATPYLIKDKLAVAKRIGPMLHRDVNDVLADISKDSGYVVIGKKVPMNEGNAIRDLHIEGLDFVDDSTRAYPRDFLASQLLGITGADNTGLTGLEYVHNRTLSGTDGKRLLVKDALGQPIKSDDERDPVDGRTLKLTLDDQIQEKAEAVLAEVGKKYQPADATAIVMDPHSGELLAVANWPRVNNNDIGAAPEWARQDHAVQTSYEPGSTFKAITMAGALQEGKVTAHSPTFNLPSYIQVADRQIHEAEGEAYGSGDPSLILQKSSNVGMIQIGELLGSADFAKWVSRFGFGRPTGADLPGEQSGIVLAHKNYSGSSMGNLPIGQGESVTPMQMATAYAAIANGGTLRPPRVVKAVGGQATPMPQGRRVITPQTAATLRTMLEGVLGPGGTASGAAIDGYVMAGKTGTAEKVDPATHQYSATKYVASFVGFAPAADPKLLTLVMVDEPTGDIYGGSVAAPAWRDIMNYALTRLRIPPG